MAIRGVILGDIAGSFLEENRRAIVQELGELDWSRYPIFEDNCQFTDDTVMTLATKYAIIKKMSFKEAFLIVGQKHHFCGWGKSFYKWMYKDPSPYNSFGNGAAMRVSFIGEYYDNLEDVLLKAEESAIVSHNHPEGIKGAKTTAACVWMAKQGKTKDEIYEYLLKQYPPQEYAFSGKTMKDLKKTYIRDITCQTSVPVALRCFLESTDYRSFLTNVMSLDCDTDTIGAIGGGIAEEYYGSTLENADEIIKRFLTQDLWEIYQK